MGEGLHKKPTRTLEYPVDIGIRGIAYHFDETVPITEIKSLAADPAMLAAFHDEGLKNFARSSISITQQAILAAKKTLAKTRLAIPDIDAVIIGASELRFWQDYQEHICSEILLGLGFHEVHAFGVNLGACDNYANLVRTARNLIIAEGYQNVLAIETNKCGDGPDERRIPPSQAVFADGAMSFITTHEQPEFVIRSLVQVNRPVMSTIVGGRAALANTLPAWRFVFDRSLRQAGKKVEDIHQFFIPNSSAGICTSMIKYLGLPLKRVYLRNVPRIGHVWSSDIFINLRDYCVTHEVPPGALMLLFCWSEGDFSSIIVEKQGP